MKYENVGVVVRLKNVTKHPNADRLQVAEANGDPVIIGLDYKENDMVAYFNSNLQICAEYLRKHNLYTSSGLNDDITKKGYFPSTGRVKATKLRGVVSYGFVASVESVFVDSTEPILEGVDIGEPFCQKYVIKTKDIATGQPNSKEQQIDLKVEEQKALPKHWSTPHYNTLKKYIDKSTLIYIEEKFHGTSGRIGNVPVKRKLRFFERALKWCGVPVDEYKYQVVHGSRKVILNPKCRGERRAVYDKLKDQLHLGEILYFEIAGYTAYGNMIQKGFTYGCEPGCHKIVLYRVRYSVGGKFHEMDREHVYQRAQELGIHTGALTGKPSTVEEIENTYSKDDPFFEGIVVWYVQKGKWCAAKHKNPAFLIAASNDDEVDGLEEF